MSSKLPEGTVTFMFTDIEGSTRGGGRTTGRCRIDREGQVRHPGTFASSRFPLTVVR